MAGGRQRDGAPPPTDGGGGFRFALIGVFAAWRDGTPLDARDLGSRKGRTLLMALLVDLDRPVSRDRLVELLWGPSPPPGAARNLASLVSRLRGLLGSGAIEAAGETYRLRAGPHVATDVADARRLLDESRTRLVGGDPALAWAAARRGLELVEGGELLAGEPDGDWLAAARAAAGDLARRLRRSGWQAALAVGDLDAAAGLAERAAAEDPLDEEACRALMEASRRRGDTAAALRAYERLRAALADELGVDPSPATRALHAAVLREEEPGPDPAAPTPAPPARASQPRGTGPGATDFVGREAEMATLERHWSRAAGGQAGLVLVTGEAGIGKTRLAEEFAPLATGTGGLLMRARCHETERSLFLAPVVESLTGLARQLPPERLRDLVGPAAPNLAALLPELTDLLRPLPYQPGSPEVERRRTFEAVRAVLARASGDHPLLVLLDDVHLADASSVELLGYLLRHSRGARLLVLATLRAGEGREVLRDLAGVAEQLDLGPLPVAAVADLARRAGAARLADRIASVTRGHTLSVVETLAALAGAGEGADEPPVPASLREAVLARVERAGPDVAELLRGAATLGWTFDLTVAARLVEIGTEDAVRRAERALEAGLLVEAGAALAFGNDLVRDIVYASTPRPARVARHARAAGLLTGRPEAVASHRTAAEDWAGALDAWLEAAEQAAARFANRDAERLLDQAVEAARRTGDKVHMARARLARARVREALADYAGELTDLEAAADLARATGRPDLEARALRELGGDVLVGLGRPATDCLPYLEAGLHVARSAGLGELEVELLGRSAVIWTNRARFDRAAEAAEAALARARQLGEERPVTLALDAVKNASAYLGDLDRLEEVTPELQRRLRAQHDQRWLPWAVFESVMPHLARAEWATATSVVDRALHLNERVGSAPWASPYLAHRSWLHRARGEYGAALHAAREAADRQRTAGHPWWSAFAATMLGWVLSDAGEDAEAVACLHRAVADAERGGMETYLARCTSHLALACWRAGDRAGAGRYLERGTALLHGVTVPPGRAFLHGAHAYAALARLQLGRGEPEAAVALLEPLRHAAETAGWREVVATDRALRGCARLVTGDAAGAQALLQEAATLAEDAGLVPLAWEARTGLARAAARLGDHDCAVRHERAAAAHLVAIASSIHDPALRRRTVDLANRRRACDVLEPPG